MTPLRPDDIHRTVLLAAHDGSQPTLEAAQQAHERTGIVIYADATACRDLSGQAALLTAVVTAKRAFGTTVVLAADSSATIPTGIFANQTTASAVAGQGATLIQAETAAEIGQDWPVLLLGSETTAPTSRRRAHPLATIRASWSGWTAKVSGSAASITNGTDTFCLPAAIAAAALGVSEAFGAVRARPGSDAGYRDATVNLWNPGNPKGSTGPNLEHAPSAW